MRVELVECVDERFDAQGKDEARVDEGESVVGEGRIERCEDEVEALRACGAAGLGGSWRGAGRERQRDDGRSVVSGPAGNDGTRRGMRDGGEAGGVLMLGRLFG